MTVVQLAPRPGTKADVERLLAAGLLLDAGGRPLVRQACPCGGRRLGGEPCHQDVTCPHCGSNGAQCMRPSGHNATEWHAERWTEYERVTQALIAAGDLTDPAPWAA